MSIQNDIRTSQNDLRTISALLGDALSQFAKLFQNEIDLAKAELGEKVQKVGGALGFIVGGAVLVIPALVMALFALSAALIAAGWSQPISYLTSAIVAAVIAGVLFAIGINRLDARNLVTLPDGLGAGTRGFAADIDQGRTMAQHVHAERDGIGRRAAGKAVGRDVEDAHDLRLIERDGAGAELQRCAGRGEASQAGAGLFGNAGGVSGDVRFKRIEGQEPLVHAVAITDVDQLHHCEEGQSSRQSENLPVITERRVDEARGA